MKFRDRAAGILGGEQFLAKDDPVLSAIAQKLRPSTGGEFGVEVRRALNLQISNKSSDINIAQRLLRFIGFKLPRLKQQRIGGERVWVYGGAAAGFLTTATAKGKQKLSLDAAGNAIVLPDGRKAVFDRWLERDKQSRQEAREKLESTVTTAPSPGIGLPKSEMELALDEVRSREPLLVKILREIQYAEFLNERYKKSREEIPFLEFFISSQETLSFALDADKWENFYLFLGDVGLRNQAAKAREKIISCGDKHLSFKEKCTHFKNSIAREKALPFESLTKMITY